MDDAALPQRQDFIRAIVAEDLRTGKHGGKVITRFPPEPNGYLHIGHAKAICLNFGIAEETGGVCHLRFDDTNPETEDIRYVESIMDTVRWLGFDWGEHLYFASDYFEAMYHFAEHLIREGKAYVDSQSEEEIRENRGTVTEPGRPSPFRNRSAEENLDLFRRMRAGEFPDGSHVLRGKVDMASPNMLMRDPVLYRIRHAHHYRTGDEWCIYPLYDYAHPTEDAIESITHSLCTLEFENNRAVYDWVVDNLPRTGRFSIPEDSRPHQYEFARGNLEYTVMSKRKLLELVKGGYVSGWDDPRMPTLAGLRRRGFTPESIRSFWERLGIAKAENRVDIGKLEFAIRDDLNQKAPRVLCVLRPLRVVITNYPEGETERLEAPYYPHDVPKEGSRELPFSREIYIERDDFMQDPPKGFHRLTPGGEVRLRYAYIIRCEEVIKDERGEVVELRCTYDPETRGGDAKGRTVKGTIHWVSAEDSLPCEVRLYDRLFRVPDPDEGEEDFKTYLNPESLIVLQGARIEPSVQGEPAGSHYQFERLGYFVSDRDDSRSDRLVFNRTVTLRDTWAKVAARAAPEPKETAKRKKPAGDRADGGSREGAITPESGGQRRSAAAAAEDRGPELEGLRVRFIEEYGLAEEDADVLTRSIAIAGLLDGTVRAGADPQTVAKWIVNELVWALKEHGINEIAFDPPDFHSLIRMVENGTLSSSGGKTVLVDMVRNGGDPAEIVARLGLTQINDPDALAGVVEEVLGANAAKVEEYRGGKTGLLGFFVGQVMGRTKGKANPELVRDLLLERL